jgi:hypothetical protein
LDVRSDQVREVGYKFEQIIYTLWLSDIARGGNDVIVYLSRQNIESGFVNRCKLVTILRKCVKILGGKAATDRSAKRLRETSKVRCSLFPRG